MRACRRNSHPQYAKFHTHDILSRREVLQRSAEERSFQKGIQKVGVVKKDGILRIAVRGLFKFYGIVVDLIAEKLNVQNNGDLQASMHTLGSAGHSAGRASKARTNSLVLSRLAMSALR